MTNTNQSYMPAASCFFLGLAAGSAVALLFAPFSGEETRRRIHKKGIDGGKSKVLDGVNEGKKRVADQVHKIDGAIQAGKEAYQTLQKGVGEGTSKVINGVNEGKKRVAEEAHRIDSAIQAGKEAYSRA
jgi:gas vesicle protein